jgi:hypothetical protein
MQCYYKNNKTKTNINIKTNNTNSTTLLAMKFWRQTIKTRNGTHFKLRGFQNDMDWSDCAGALLEAYFWNA